MLIFMMKISSMATSIATNYENINRELPGHLSSLVSIVESGPLHIYGLRGLVIPRQNTFQKIKEGC